MVRPVRKARKEARAPLVRRVSVAQPVHKALPVRKAPKAWQDKPAPKGYRERREPQGCGARLACRARKAEAAQPEPQASTGPSA